MAKKDFSLRGWAEDVVAGRAGMQAAVDKAQATYNAYLPTLQAAAQAVSDAQDAQILDQSRHVGMPPNPTFIIAIQNAVKNLTDVKAKAEALQVPINAAKQALADFEKEVAYEKEQAAIVTGPVETTTDNSINIFGMKISPGMLIGGLAAIGVLWYFSGEK